MIQSKKLKLLFVFLACFVFAKFACADMIAVQNGGVVTITDTGTNPDGSFIVRVNGTHDKLIIKSSDGDPANTVFKTFNASTVQQIRIYTGEGDDRVVLRTSISVAGNQVVQSYPDIDVRIQTGIGDDQVYIAEADIGDLSIVTGPGDDIVNVTHGSVVNEDLSISTSAGNDVVALNSIDVYKTTTVLTGSGIDEFETLGSLFVRQVLVDAGPSMDQISIGGPAPSSNRQNQFLSASKIFGGSGNDLINVDNGEYALMRIDGGLGFDCYVPYGTFRFDTSFRLSDIDVCRPEFPFGSQQVYKTVGDQDLELILVKPDDWETGDQRPAILFFHGGNWRSGTPLQMLDQANYFAKRGLVCVLVQYRLMDPEINNQPPLICIHDAKSAMRFARSNATLLGIDPDRIASSGASAGGHLAAFLGTIDGHDDPQDDLSVSARPNAMCLFCPVYDNGPEGYGFSRFGDMYSVLSPMHNITPDDTPNIVLLGSDDHAVPVATARRFRRSMLNAGVDSDLRIYEGGPHSFFLQRFHDGVFYRSSLSAMHVFLRDLGWVEGPPVVADF